MQGKSATAQYIDYTERLQAVYKTCQLSLSLLLTAKTAPLSGDCNLE